MLSNLWLCCSPVFSQALRDSALNLKTFTLDTAGLPAGTTRPACTVLLHFAYTGLPNWPVEHTPELSDTVAIFSKQLQMDALWQTCEQHKIQSMSAQTAIRELRASDRLKMAGLRTAAERVLATQFEMVAEVCDDGY